MSRRVSKVYLAADGREALTILENTHIDLAICDLMMPFLDGFQLMETAAASQLYTAYIDCDGEGRGWRIKRGFALGTDDYMVKPVDMNEMIWRVWSPAAPRPDCQ